MYDSLKRFPILEIFLYFRTRFRADAERFTQMRIEMWNN